MNFEVLIESVKQTHIALQQNAVKAINVSLTIRNWLIGCYIVEYEQKGEDRAKYGENLLKNIEVECINNDIRGITERSLRTFRMFYQTYPQIRHTLSADFIKTLIRQTVSDELKKEILQTSILSLSQIRQTVSAELQSPANQNYIGIKPEKIISRLPFSHIVELLQITDSLKRAFYEMESIKGNWSVRELRRQINTLYYERSGLSKDKKKLSKLINQDIIEIVPRDVLQNPLTFEFLGLKARDVVYENDLEKALIEHIEEFMLELGHGFCFEARQKRILIGDEYFFIDIVFYHRILKCHVLIELKVDEFKHEYIGQLNTYVNYYKKEVMQKGDNPPVGILMVTNKNNVLVEYATADLDAKLFVSKYEVELPAKEKLIEFINKEVKEFE